MVSLDDSREHLGASPADDAARIPLVKPKIAETPAAETAPVAPPQPAPAAPPAGEQASGSQPAAQAELDAAEALVKDFPLAGDRGTVAQWLQYSYNASPDAGKETWSASATGDKGYLVEYRFIPTARGRRGACEGGPPDALAQRGGTEAPDRRRRRFRHRHGQFRPLSPARSLLNGRRL